MVGVNLHHSLQRPAPERPPPAIGHHIGGAHATQILHQRDRRRVAHQYPVGIGHRQREACALEQRAGSANIGERSDTGGDAVLDLGLGRREGLAQLGQRVAAGKCCKQQAVGLQHTADSRRACPADH